MKRILVADDSVTIQKVIALTFADEAFEVQSVGTGSEALELVKSWKPDIVLADVIMPQMNGYELCRAVKQQQDTRSVPVLLLAGTFEAFDEEEARSVGANDFITKPFESGELIEKVKTLIGGLPAPSQPESAPAATSAAAEADTSAGPGMPQQIDAPAPASMSGVSEPDIWDILSESGDEVRAQPGEGPAAAPGFGPIETAGVVDVGSFDVGIGRPESKPAPPHPPGLMPTEAGIPGAGRDEASPVQPPSAAPPAPGQTLDAEERSRVENMEKDFFGFETGAVEEVPGADILEDAVEEVTFEMEPLQQAAPEVDAQEVSFVVPEPAGDQPAVTGETVSPDFLAPEPRPASAPELVQPAPSPVEGSQANDVIEFAGGAPDQVPSPASPPVEALKDREASPAIDLGDDRREEKMGDVAAPTLKSAMDLEDHTMEEPPLELSVDLSSELPEEYSPGPADEPGMDASGEAARTQADPVSAPTHAVPGVPDDAAIRKLIEEKVEKIAWEVVPEMAEVIIREAIQKIKNGS
jgi:CheY-like chemotaxis protein